MRIPRRTLGMCGRFPKEGPPNPKYKPKYTGIPVMRTTPKQIGLNMIGPVGSYYWVGSEEATLIERERESERDIYRYMYEL